LKIGLTFDKREDYGISRDSEVFADFCGEHEVSYMARAIESLGYEVELIGNMFKLNKQLREGRFNCDLVFIADEGIYSRNREMIVPALLELNNIPYVGSDAYAMGLSQNKFHTKLTAEFLGISTPKCVYIPYSLYGNGEETLGHIKAGIKEKQLCFPLVVKPNCEGYSMGVFKVWNIDELYGKVVWNMENYRQEVLVEEYISGDEISVPIIGSGNSSYVLGVDLCLDGDGAPIDIFTLKNKCFEKITDRPAEYGRDTMAILEKRSLELYRHFGCRHFGRADYKVTQDLKVYFLELNPRPGLTQNGPFETCAKAAGRTYADVLGEIIGCASEVRS
jgi:D-alanine-D-alanine ligase